LPFHFTKPEGYFGVLATAGVMVDPQPPVPQPSQEEHGSQQQSSQP
jgi:hypothetical protein